MRLRFAQKPRDTPDTNRSEFVGPGRASTPNTSTRKMACVLSITIERKHVSENVARRQHSTNSSLIGRSRAVKFGQFGQSEPKHAFICRLLMGAHSLTCTSEM